MLVRDRLDRLASHIAPGMGGRPFAIGTLSAALMILYQYEGSPGAAPRWFVEGAMAVTQLPSETLHRHLWAHLTAVLLLLGIPLGIAWSAEGWGPRELGLGVRGAHREVVLALVLWVAMIPIVWVCSETSAFQATYPRVPEVRGDVTLFVAHELFYLVKWTAWEFFFRGFLLFGLARDFLGRAALVSTIAFALMHMGKPEAEALGSIAAGFVLCALALRSRSIWPGVILHALVAATMDFFASDFWR